MEATGYIHLILTPVMHSLKRLKKAKMKNQNNFSIVLVIVIHSKLRDLGSLESFDYYFSK
jgi:hypothetical protein